MNMPRNLPITLDQLAVENGQASGSSISMNSTAGLAMAGVTALPVSISQYIDAKSSTITTATQTSGSIGFNSNNSSPGSMADTTFKGVGAGAIVSLFQNNIGDHLIMEITDGGPGPTATYFKSVWINGTLYLTSNATFVLNGIVGKWDWGAVAPGLVTSTTYRFYLSV